MAAPGASRYHVGVQKRKACVKPFMTGVFVCYLANAFLFGTMSYVRTGRIVNGVVNGLTYPGRLLALTYIPELATTMNKISTL